MVTEREALKLALEALELTARDYREQRHAITAIREALAQPEQEPVAWMIWLHGPAGHFDHKQFAELEFERRNKEYPDPDRKLLPLYTHPPQRKPLTDEEISNIWCKVSNTDFVTADTHEFARAIEAAHGIKGES